MPPKTILVQLLDYNKLTLPELQHLALISYGIYAPKKTKKELVHILNNPTPTMKKEINMRYSFAQKHGVSIEELVS